MSGRRSSRPASSRASSVAFSDLGHATPRRSARNNPIFEGSPMAPPMPELAPLAARGSTSYGSSMAITPIEFRSGGHGSDLTETLTGILGTVQENLQTTYGQESDEPNQPEAQAPVGSAVGSRGRGRRGASSAPSASNAPVASTAAAATKAPTASKVSAANNGPASNVPAAGRGRGRPSSQAPSVTSTPALNNTVSYLGESSLYGDATFNEDVATTPPRRPVRRSAKPPTGAFHQQVAIEPATERPSLWMQLIAMMGSLYELMNSGFGTLTSVSQRVLSRWDLLVLLLVFAGIASLLNRGFPKDDLQSASFDISHQIRQWIPSSFSSPLSYLNDLDISNLQGRMSVVENELHSMKKHIVLHREALEELKKILPEEMYLSKVTGEAELPPNFWKALTQNVPKDSDDKSKSTSRSEWDDFISQNEAKVKAWHAEVSEELWAQHLREALKDGGVLVSKAGVIEMIKKQWDQSEIIIQKQVRNEMGNVAKNFRQGTGITRQEAVDIYNELTVKAFAKTQDSKNVAYYQLQRPNHFSFGLGAVVNPSVTSPTYAFAKARAWWPKRLILWSVGYGMPTPNPPAEALRKWDEAGDCWCSPAKGSGTGVQLGVLMANDLFPKEIVIEHIPKGATLDYASTPRHMELLAHISSFKDQGTVGELADKIFPGFYEGQLGQEWILIGTWRYDMDDENHVQHFYPQIDLQSLGVSVRQLIVRAKSNQGDSDHTCLYRVRVHGEVAEKSTAWV